MSGDESLKIPYLMEVLDCLAEVSIGGIFCWVRIFKNAWILLLEAIIFQKV